MKRVHGFSGNVPASADHIRRADQSRVPHRRPSSGRGVVCAQPYAAAVSVLRVRPPPWTHERTMSQIAVTVVNREAEAAELTVE